MHSYILIIDDHPLNLAVMASMVAELEECEAVCFEAPEQALAWCARNDPSLVVVDYEMPSFNGAEFTRLLRKLDGKSDTPVIMITVASESSVRYEALNAGVSDFLSKPVDRIEFLVRAKNLLALAHSRAQLARRAEWLATEVKKATAEVVAREAETAQLNAAYYRFVPHQFLQLLGRDSVADVVLGDQAQRSMTLLIADIRAFSTLSELMTPRETFNFLNSYLNRVSPVIRKHGGFTDKYIGDAIMALFPNSVDDAVAAAFDLLAELGTYNSHRAKSGYEPIAIGIGVHTGTLILGTIGETQRMETTVIGDAVNCAFRLEGLCKQYGAPCVISHEAVLELKHAAEHAVRWLGLANVKGRHEPLSVYELFDADGAQERALKNKTRVQFEEGVSRFASGHTTEAAWCFHNVLALNEKDVPATLYLERCGAVAQEMHT